MGLGALGALWSVPAWAKATVSLQMAPVGQWWECCRYWAGLWPCLQGSPHGRTQGRAIVPLPCHPQRGAVFACWALGGGSTPLARLWPCWPWGSKGCQSVAANVGCALPGWGANTAAQGLFCLSGCQCLSVGWGNRTDPLCCLGPCWVRSLVLAEESRRARPAREGHPTLPSLLTCPFLLFLQVLSACRG